MRVLLALACLAAVAMSAPTASTDDPFITLIKQIETADFFRTLTDRFRLLTFEMLTAAETYNLHPLLDNVGYAELLKYVDALPKDYEHQFIKYVVSHLEIELAASS